MDYNNEPPKIVFEGEEFKRPSQSFQTPTPKIVDWVIKYSGGAIKDEQQANYFLIGFTVLAIAVSLFLFFGGGSTQQKPTTTSIEQMKQFMNAVPQK